MGKEQPVALKDFMSDQKQLQSGFRKLHLLVSENSSTLAGSISAAKAECAYDEIFRKYEWNAIPKAKSKPSFNEEMYPSLFGGIGVLPDDHEALESWWIDLPTAGAWWAAKDVQKQMASNPLLRALVAFLWKQGDLHTAGKVIAGLTGAAASDEGAAEEGDDGSDASDERPKLSAAVMLQFAKHLRDPLNQPIFDQHTSRAHLLYTSKSSWWNEQELDPKGFANLFGGRSLPQSNQSLTNEARKDGYVRWWQGAIGCRLAHLDRSEDANTSVWKDSDRAQALLWMDRFMFSLGKAALGLRRAAAKIEAERVKVSNRKSLISPDGSLPAEELLLRERQFNAADL